MTNTQYRTKIMARNSKKKWKIGNSHGRTGNMVKNTENRAKWETHTGGPGKWGETVKNLKYDK
jgi:hypothetical protein